MAYLLTLPKELRDILDRCANYEHFRVLSCILKLHNETRTYNPSFTYFPEIENYIRNTSEFMRHFDLKCTLQTAILDNNEMYKTASCTIILDEDEIVTGSKLFEIINIMIHTKYIKPNKHMIAELNHIISKYKQQIYVKYNLLPIGGDNAQLFLFPST